MSWQEMEQLAAIHCAEATASVLRGDGDALLRENWSLLREVLAELGEEPRRVLREMLAEFPAG